MLRNILLGLVALVLILFVVVAVQPAEYHIERSAQIEAPAEVVWAQVSDFNQWQKWNPWEQEDPDQKTTITGEAGAVGHESAWDGEITGKGSMTISEVKALEHLSIDLDFLEPFESSADTAIDVEPSGSGVKVTWSMDGENDFVGKAFDLMMNMDDMIGSKYAEGLANLKALSESEAKRLAEEAQAAAEAAAEAEEMVDEAAAQ